MTHAFIAEPMILFCPRCHGQHEDFGEWATRPHSMHRCMFCKNEWRPFEHHTVGVALRATQKKASSGLMMPLAVYKDMYEYSHTMPTDPRPGFYWRRSWPDRLIERRREHSFAVIVPHADDPPGQVSIVWRELFVAEWFAGDLLSKAMGAAA